MLSNFYICEREVAQYDCYDKYYTKEQQTKELVKMYNKENNNVISLDDYSEIMNKAIFP